MDFHNQFEIKMKYGKFYWEIEKLISCGCGCVQCSTFLTNYLSISIFHIQLQFAFQKENRQ